MTGRYEFFKNTANEMHEFCERLKNSTGWDYKRIDYTITRNGLINGELCAYNLGDEAYVIFKGDGEYLQIKYINDGAPNETRKDM